MLPSEGFRTLRSLLSNPEILRTAEMPIPWAAMGAALERLKYYDESAEFPVQDIVFQMGGFHRIVLDGRAAKKDLQ